MGRAQPYTHRALTWLALALVPALLAGLVQPPANGVTGTAPEPAGVGAVRSVQRHGDTLELGLDSGDGADRLVVSVLAPDLVRVDYRPRGQTSPRTQLVDPASRWPNRGSLLGVDTRSDPITLRTARLRLEISRSPARLALYDAAGRRLLTEEPAGGVHGDGVRFRRHDGDHLYGITGYPLPDLEDDPAVRAGQGLVRDRGGVVRAGQQGDGGAPLAFTRGFGLLVDSVDGRFSAGGGRLAFDGVSRPNVEYYLSVGDPKATLRAVTRVSGAPPMPPKWALGFQNSEWGTDEAEVRDLVRGYRSRGIPLDAFVLDFDFKAWGEDNFGEFRWNSSSGAGNVHPNKFPSGASGRFAADLAARGVQLTGIMKPRILIQNTGGGQTRQARETARLGCFYPGQRPYEEYFSKRLARDLRFDTQACRDYHWRLADPLWRSGIRGWWNDEADAGPGTLFDSLQHANMQRSLYEGQRSVSGERVYSLNRNFYLGAQRYAYAQWTGDIKVDPKDGGFATLAAQRERLLALVNLGQSWVTMDTGGFHGTPSPEAYARWMQMAALTPIMRVHGAQYEQRQPWRYGPAAEKVAADAIRLRYRLLPYLYAQQRLTQQGGPGLMRPLFHEFPAERAVANETGAWMLGDWLLARPVVEPGARTVQVRLPAGTDWIDYHRGTRHRGGQALTYPVSLRDVPLFVRAGAILPTQPVLQHTGQRPAGLDLDVFPSDQRTGFTHYEDDGHSYGYERGDFLAQRFTVRRRGRATVFTAGPRTGHHAPAVGWYLARIHGVTPGAGSALPGRRYRDLAALRAASGAGWTTGADRFGPFTAVRLPVGRAVSVVVR